MSALQFLNKKSWHTSTIKNNEKVWIREQEAAREEARIKELQKQISEERRQEDLQRLEEESGRVDEGAKLKRRRLNWMYEYNEKAEKEKESEDIMLGKKKLDLTEKTNGEEQEQRAIQVDGQTKLREDPMSCNLNPTPTTTNVQPVGSLSAINKKNKRREEKLLRKQQRDHIRQQKRLKRERRAQFQIQFEQQQQQQQQQQQELELELQKKQQLERDESSCRSKGASSHYSSGVRATGTSKADDHDDRHSDSVQPLRRDVQNHNRRPPPRSRSRSRSPARRPKREDSPYSSDAPKRRGLKRRSHDDNSADQGERRRSYREYYKEKRARRTYQRDRDHRDRDRSRYSREYYRSDDDSKRSPRSCSSDDRYYSRSDKRKPAKQKYSSYSSSSSSSSSSSFESCHDRGSRYKGSERKPRNYSSSRKY